MNRLSVAAVTIFALVGSIAGLLYLTNFGQDALFKRAANQILNAESKPLEGMRVTVCGSASPLGFDPDRAQACIAVVTPEHFFLFDVGARSPLRIQQARLPLDRLDGVFLTHFHSDHIAGLADVNLASWVQGRPSALKVFGPTGVTKVVEGLNHAYELDYSYRTAHHGDELLPPELGPMQARTFRKGDVVWQDNLMTISSFVVEHPPVEPAVGYRIDYKGRTVVISGDTNVTEVLFEHAKDADLVLHDALSLTLLEPMMEIAPYPINAIMADVIDYHANIETLSSKALDAGIKKLVLYHMVPVPTNALTEKMFLRGIPAEITLAKDLQSFDLPANTKEIVINEP